MIVYAVIGVYEQEGGNIEELICVRESMLDAEAVKNTNSFDYLKIKACDTKEDFDWQA